MTTTYTSQDFPSGHVLTADQMAAVNAGIVSLAKAGYVAESTDTTSNVGTTTTEVVSSSVQFTAEAGRRHEVLYTGVAESSVALDIMTLKLRWKLTNTADITGAIFATDNKTSITASKGDAFGLVGQFVAAASGTHTVVATIVRIVGTGTVKQNGSSAGQALYFLVKDIGN